jgi:hypothetical protein
MYYPAEDKPAYVNNSSADQQYSFNWNQIEQSYQDTNHVDLETSTWPRVPSLPRTLPANTQYSTQLSGSFPTSIAYQAQPTLYETAGSRLQEQDSGEISTLPGGAALSRDRCLRKRGESDNVLATPRTLLGRDDQLEGESFQPKMWQEVPRV